MRKEIPKDIEKIVYTVRDRVKELTKTYGSLSRWGRPYLFSLEEVSAICFLNEKIGYSLERLSREIGVDKTSLYKLVKRAKEGKVSYYDPKENVVKTVSISFSELLEITERKLSSTAKMKISDPLKSEVIRNFIFKSVRKRAIRRGKSEFLSDQEKRRTLSVISRIMKYIMERCPDIPSNPDMWNEEMILQVLNKMVEDGIISVKTKRHYMKMLRRVWKDWFTGLIGAEISFIEPIERVLFYKDYLRLKQLYLEGKVSEKEFLVISLHLSTGAREGYTLHSPGTDLEDARVVSSLVGLRWENIIWRGEFEENSIVVKIYESKTNKWWRADPSWLDPQISELLKKYAKERGSIIKTIVGVKTVGEFFKWYSKVLKRISKLLGLQFTLKPHDIRRSSLSIKAELGIPLELAVSDRVALGVGWEDLKTAVVFYLRFSKFTIKRLYETICRNREEYIKTVS